MGIFRKKVVEVCCRLYPLVAVFAPFALGVGIEHLDDLAGFDRVIVEDAGTDLIGHGLAVAQAIEGNIFVFVFAVDGEDVVVGGSEARVGVLKVAEIFFLRLELLRNCQWFIQQTIPNLSKSFIVVKILIGLELVRSCGALFYVFDIRRVSILGELRALIQGIAGCDKFKDFIATSEWLEIVQQHQCFNLGRVQTARMGHILPECVEIMIFAGLVHGVQVVSAALAQTLDRNQRWINGVMLFIRSELAVIVSPLDRPLMNIEAAKHFSLEGGDFFLFALVGEVL